MKLWDKDIRFWQLYFGLVPTRICNEESLAGYRHCSPESILCITVIPSLTKCICFIFLQYQITTNFVANNNQFINSFGGQIPKWFSRTVFFQVFPYSFQPTPLLGSQPLLPPSRSMTPTSSLTLTLLLPSNKNNCDYIWPIWIIQNNSPKIINLITFIKFILLSKATYIIYRFQRLGCVEL